MAEAELEYDPNFISPSIMLRLKLSKMPSRLANIKKESQNVYGIIWTTTPWTLPSNQAVCYNPSLEYSAIKINNDDSNIYLIASKLVAEFLDIINQNAESLITLRGKFIMIIMMCRSFEL